MRSPLASTQPGPTPVTCICVWTSTPMLELGFGFGGEISGYAASTRGPPSSSMTRLLVGSMWRKSWRM
jgi:hypothetical protein